METNDIILLHGIVSNRIIFLQKMDLDLSEALLRSSMKTNNLL